MKFKKVVAIELVPQWQDRYLNYYHLKSCIKHHAQASVKVEEREIEDGEDKERRIQMEEFRTSGKSKKGLAGYERRPSNNKVYEAFEDELVNELNKVDAFFRSRETKFSARLQELNNEIELMKAGTKASPSSVNALRKAYHDNHMEWKLLRKFQETNKYGFLKILKRYDTELKTDQFDLFLDNYFQNTSFWESKSLEETIAGSERVYTEYFAASDDRLAKSELRRTKVHRKVTEMFAVAFFFGIIVAFFIAILYTWVEHYPSVPPSRASIGWFVYRLCLLPILLAVLFSLSTYLWEKDHINYVFIFKFNPLHYRSPMMYLQYAFFVLGFWILSFYLYMDSIIVEDDSFHGLLHPLIFVCVMAALFFLPLPILGHQTRFYLIRQISRVIRAGLPGKINVSFADFIMAVKLISLSEFLFDFQVMFCMFGLRDDALCGGDVYALPILSALPHWCRMWQCIRRWRQTGQAYPHLASGIRPFTTLISVTLSVLAKNYPEQKAILYLWLTLNSCFSIIRWYLDILIDWSFIKFGHFTLRKQRLYKPKWLYYFVMADNLFLRLVWLIVYLLRKEAKVQLNHPMLLLFLSCFELLWGFQFVFFRMENEHFNCKDRYDIIHDVPLPFTKKYDALAKKNALKKMKRDKRIDQSIIHKITQWWNKMPWANSKNKLRESIAKAISEVEKEHPSLSRQHSVANFGNFGNFSSSNLSILSNSANFERQHVPSLASTPLSMSPSPSASVHNQRVIGPHAKQLSLSPLMQRSTSSLNRSSGSEDGKDIRGNNSDDDDDNST